MHFIILVYIYINLGKFYYQRRGITYTTPSINYVLKLFHILLVLMQGIAQLSHNMHLDNQY
jgi:hypothetical protein